MHALKGFFKRPEKQAAGCGSTVPGYESLSKLHRAIADSDLARVKHRLATLHSKNCKADLFSLDSLEQTPLIAAIYSNNVPIVEELLKFYKEHDIDINKQDKQMYSPLHHAAQTGEEQVLVKLLKFEGVDVKLKNQDENTPLHYFCEKFKYPHAEEPFKKFVELGADVNCVNTFGETPLHKSCLNKSIRLIIVNLLLEAGADVNVLNSFGEAPLHFAVRILRDDLVQTLLKAGADIYIRGKEKKTPLEIAQSLKAQKDAVQIAPRLQKVQELYEWLKSVDPEIYTQHRTKFVAEALFLDVMPMADNSILEDIGITESAHRLKIIKAAQKLKTEGNPIPKPGTPFTTPLSKSSSRISSLLPPGSLGPSGELNTNQWIMDFHEFEFTNKVGKGTSGKVYKALYKGANVAVKVLKPWEDDTEADEFRKEFEVMCVLRGANVVTFFGACLEPKLCMVMEYCDRGTLYDVLNDTKVEIGWDKVLKFSQEMTKGMMVLHNHNPAVFHRDFKSLNVLVTKKWECKISDFGLSRFNTESNKMNTLKEVRGTFPYCAPELVPDMDKPCSTVPAFTAKCDIYSIGITFWEIVKRCVDGRYSKPWYSEHDFPMDFMIVVEAQKGNRPTLLPCQPDLTRVASVLASPPVPAPAGAQVTTPTTAPTTADTTTPTAIPPESAAPAPTVIIPPPIPEKGKAPAPVVTLYRDCVHPAPAQRPDLGQLLGRLVMLEGAYRQFPDLWAQCCTPHAGAADQADTTKPL
eukprot:TRINITY_DN5901_c0_g1_i1.p1 TRINITY_DN5901_c0_g1~~TRINITY_DN5901_c0_g1_i1.p1  ORF type:complete len:749 (-),score=176.24 TRINITY_DN5901_c0_g1_i1:79-2325(-)